MRSFVVDNRRVLMKKLLLEDAFDRFLLSEAVIRKGVLFSVDGHKSDGEIAAYGSLRDLVYRFIQGNKTPSFMKLVLLSPENLPGVASRSINILFREDLLTITSGFSYSQFVTDRTEEGNWDAWVQCFFANIDIEFEG